MIKEPLNLSSKMLCRNILLLSLVILFVQADLDQDGDNQAMSTDHDSTSDEAPTESMNSISSDQPNDASSTSSEVTNDGHLLSNSLTGGADRRKSSNEDQDESPNSEEAKR
ncbi:formin-like protein 2 isoform X1 [Arapaima gigas]